MSYDAWPDNSNSTGDNIDGTDALHIYTDRTILSGHLITFAGTATADTYNVQLDASGQFVKIWENTSTSNPATFMMHKLALAGSGAGLVFDLLGGNDTLTIASNVLVPTTVRGGAGSDTLAGGGGADTLDFTGVTNGLAVDLASGSATSGGATDVIWGFENVIGGSGNDNILGDVSKNVLDGGPGDDFIDGDHSITESGGGDDDTILGGDGNDSILGDSGQDSIDAGAGADTVRGGPGHDTLRGGDDGDIIYGDEGFDVAYGGDHNDAILGGDGNDSLYGEAGSDSITGGAGTDLLDGAAGDDWFYALDQEEDTLFGGAGFDRAQADTTTDPPDILDEIEELL